MKMYVSMSYGLVALLLMIISLWCTETMAQATIYQLKVQQQHLKRLKKPAVKSIKSPDGDIIDCVHIYHQPAFDHPLLKNHTIQMRPSLLPSGLYDENEESSSIPQLWHQKGRCPEGTIPIRRTKKEDVLRASSVERYGKKSPGTIPNPTSSQSQPLIMDFEHDFAIAFARGDKYYGAKATINVWNPMVERPYEFSASEIWVLGGPSGQEYSVEVGWHNDGYKSTGCFNLICPGFIQVNKDIALGAFIHPISSYGGRQYEITLLIYKDPKTGNWWMQFGNRSAVGYRPSSLFHYLYDSASVVEWGGQIVSLKVNSGQHTSTRMGSGHFPDEGFRRASFFRNYLIVDQSNHLRAPSGGTRAVSTNTSCYRMQYGENYHFYYGGPGRNPDCP